MPKRIVPALLIAGLLLGACGSEAGTPAAVGSLPPVADGHQHPTGAEEVVIDDSQLGGFVPQEIAFQQIPNALISGDGRVFTPGAQIAIYPGPLLPAVQVRTISEAGIQTILGAADDAGLLADVVYEQPTNIADAPTAHLSLTVDGRTFVHDAYALGLSDPDGSGTETTPERQALAGFLSQLSDLGMLVGSDQLGEQSVFEPTSYAIQAIRVDDLSSRGSDGLEPTVVEWPSRVNIRLVDAAVCTVFPANEVGDTLAAANQLTYFSDAGVTYQVLATPLLPGTDCA